MKLFLFTFVMAWAVLPSFAFAANKVFKVEAEYTKPGWDAPWSDLEQLGIERAAEKRAFAACEASGATDCVILDGANITGCGYMVGGPDASGCKASALARGNQ